jgi:ectoine hydroxylase
MTRVAVEDRYPTRVDPAPPAFPRRDPVVYSAESGPLRPDELRRFQRDGFLVRERLLDDVTVDRLRLELERMATDPELASSDRIVREPGGDAVRSIFEVHRLSVLIARIVADKRLAAAARQVLGSDVYVHQSRVNRKPGFIGQGFSWHSDFETWHAEDGMPAPRAVSVAVALTPNFVHNGSLMIIPGSHRTFVPTVGTTPEDHYRNSLRAQEIGVPDDVSLAALVEAGGGVEVVTGEPGSAVLFDCNAMHGSTNNITPYPRTNLFVVYNSVANSLMEPFAAPAPRPEFIASRSFAPVE